MPDRNIKNVEIQTEQSAMAQVYTQKINAVLNMLENDGPIYNVWIVFQIGINTPITFNTSSQDKNKNLIANLSFKKSGAGVTNTFTLTIQYDPFNSGQDTQDVVEQLDEYIATAMEADWNTLDEVSDFLRGSIQYGYNTTSDENLVSPKYTFYLTGATSDVKFDSGITTYTFEGTSVIASDCEFTTTYDAFENRPVLEVVEQTLYYWYGDADNPPAHSTNITPHSSASNYKYIIDIPDSVYQQGKQDCAYGAVTDVSPWQYCSDLLQQFPLTQAEEQSGNYDDLATLTYNKRPRYTMYITDTDNKPTIRITHFAPAGDEKSDLSIDYEFTWGTQNKNIITNWKPQVDLKLYLIRKARVNRAEKLMQQYESTDDESLKQKYYDELVTIQDDLVEMFNAQITILGIPADPPLGAEVRIKPKILETVSRTARSIYDNRMYR